MLNKTRSSLAISLASLILLAQPAAAKVTAEEAARLGKELTPVGAERAGNADGTIPQWTPAEKRGALKEEFPSDPALKDEKPLFAITSANMAEHEGKLTEGHKELLRRYPDSYKLNVFKSYRKANFPQKILDETIKNATRAELEGVDNP
ncbi:MAG: DUF1329 domain-containing protein, partial [Nevskiales bacterium]